MPQMDDKGGGKPKGDDPPPTFTPERWREELWSMVEPLVDELGFSEDFEREPGEARFAVLGTVERLNDKHGVEYTGEEWQRILFAREFLKVLAGAVFGERIRTALVEVPEERQKLLFDRVAEELTPEAFLLWAERPTYFYDPRQWSIASIPVRDTREQYLRLSQIVSAMLYQEDGLEQAGIGVAEMAWRVGLVKGQE